MFQRKHKFFIIKSSYSNGNRGENGKLTKSETRRKTVSAGAESLADFLPKPKLHRNSYFQPKLAESESSVGHYTNVEQTKVK
jgi:hypothetical protein